MTREEAKVEAQRQVVAWLDEHGLTGELRTDVQWLALTVTQAIQHDQGCQDLREDDRERYLRTMPYALALMAKSYEVMTTLKEQSDARNR